MRRTIAILGMVALSTGVTALATSGGAGAQAVEESFEFTGAAEDFAVPADVCSITVVAVGARGGDSFEDNQPGFGAPGGSATATMPVTPGETLTVVVGGAGETPVDTDATDDERGAQVVPAAGTQGNAGGFNGGGDGGDGPNPGGGGGGLTELQRAGVAVVIAGGGGGAGGYQTAGDGGAGGESGEDGGDASSGAGGGASGGNGGGGGQANIGDDGDPSVGTQGGDGDDGVDAGGGGAGGATGGGGGASNEDFGLSGGGGGGGGSSLGPAGTVFATGVDGAADGNGVLTLSWEPGAGCVSPLVVEPTFTG